MHLHAGRLLPGTRCPEHGACGQDARLQQTLETASRSVFERCNSALETFSRWLHVASVRPSKNRAEQAEIGMAADQSQACLPAGSSPSYPAKMARWEEPPLTTPCSERRTLRALNPLSANTADGATPRATRSPCMTTIALDVVASASTARQAPRQLTGATWRSKRLFLLRPRAGRLLRYVASSYCTGVGRSQARSSFRCERE